MDGPASVAFEFDAAETFGLADGQQADLLTVPELELTVRPLGIEATLFVRPYHVPADGEAVHINDAVTPVRIDGTPDQPQTVPLELVAFQRDLSPGDTLRLVVNASDAAFNGSRESLGAVVDHESTLRLPGVSVLDDPVV